MASQFRSPPPLPPVRILNVSRVPLPPPPHPTPGDTVPLSLYDATWIALPHIQRLFLFPDAVQLPFAGSLRSALARTLPLFHPFAGQLTYLPASGDAVIDCSPSCFGGAGAGVTLVEAESDADVGRLAKDETHDVECYHLLVPDLGVDELPAAAMAVQVTVFSGGGMAVGIAVHHTVADGKGVWWFMEMLAAACRGAALAEGAAAPSHDRAAIRVPGGDEIARRYMKLISPDLPRLRRSPADPSATKRHLLARRTFKVDAAAIRSLKRRALHQSATVVTAQALAPSLPTPSTFASLSAHAWICIAKAKGFDRDGGSPISLIFLADCRSRLDPPVGESFTGNCVRVCFAWATGRELAGAVGLSRACTVIKEAVQEAVEEPLKGCETAMDEYSAIPKERITHISGSPRFRPYAIDFGWGRPGRVELVSMNHDGEVLLVGGKEEGSVQVSVALSVDQMEEFARAFLGGLKD